ncbi:hypothetical protein ACN09C_14820 [Serratia fonticola]|uniref:hypothetical protein n=1 Tax=Serratia fonticola TaxID=47917 RepID=UPI003AFF958B
MNEVIEKIITDIEIHKGRKYCANIHQTLRDDGYVPSICNFVRSVRPEKVTKLIAYIRQLEKQVADYEQLKQRLDAANCILSEFRKIGDLMLAQDNRCTDQPMFIVFEKVEVVSHEDYDHDRICWIYDGVDCDERTSKRLEALHQGGRDCGEYQRVAVKDIGKFVTACFTEQGCKEYLAANGHNLRLPFICAAGSFRNSEYQSIRNALIAIAKTPATSSALAEQQAIGADACVRALATSDDDDFTDAPNICAMVAFRLRNGEAV